jgi:hypothetical protein
VIVVDNWFNSPELVDYCKAKGMGLLGTVQPRRAKLPKSMAGSVAKDKDDRGTSWELHKDGVTVTTWVDRKVVRLLSLMPIGRCV